MPVLTDATLSGHVAAPAGPERKVYKGMVQLMSEVNTLIHANPGQLTGGTRVFS